jgi:hypothetical protein
MEMEWLKLVYPPLENTVTGTPCIMTRPRSIKIDKALAIQN